MILELTVTGPEGCLQVVAFTSVPPMVRGCQIQLDKTRLVRPRRSRSLPIMGTEHRLSDDDLEDRIIPLARSGCKSSEFLAPPVLSYTSDFRVSAHSLSG